MPAHGDPKPVELEQLKTLKVVLRRKYVKDWSVAIDGGANKGLWTEVMAKRFDLVHAFEPNPISFATLKQRTINLPNVICHEVALLNGVFRVTLESHHKRNALTSCRAFAAEDGDAISMPIDALGLKTCGLIKLDLEGGEVEALEGARKTIKRCRPVLIIEENKPIPGLQFGENCKYEVVMKRGIDVVLVPIW